MKYSTTAFVIAFAVGLAACASKQTPPPPPLKLVTEAPPKPQPAPPPLTGEQLLNEQPSEVRQAIKDHQNGGDWETYRTAQYVLFPFDEGADPVVDSAPLRITDIQLQPGETITDVAMGDTERWMATPAASGDPRNPVPHLAIKPQAPGISTNLTIYTTKHIYHLALRSRTDGRVWIESYGEGMTDTGVVLLGSQVESLIGTVAASLGAVANNETPLIEGELPIGGIRFEGLLPPVARKPCCVMRKPAQVLYSLEDYVRDEIITTRQAEIFRDAMDRRLNIVIAGGTGSGKTTLAGALINEMVQRSDPNERYVIIEDTLEIQCRARNLVQLHTSDAADLTRLVRATMRLRPDRIIIGEVRGGEALALL